MRRDPAPVTVAVYVSQAVASLGRPREAFARLEKVAEKQPSDTPIWLRLGELSLPVGNTARAVKHLPQARQLQPQIPTVSSTDETSTTVPLVGIIRQTLARRRGG